ncbi:MAG: putative DNA binding domain-containing protein [Gemmatimonadaceae bacterium]
MDADTITTLAASGESEMLEFKRSTGQRTDVAKTVCAMLNNRGGRVLIGVEPDGTVLGQEVGAQTVEQLVQELGHIDPPAFPSIERVPVSPTHDVIVVSVTGGRSRPYAYRERAYRRVGSTNHELSRDEYNALLLERVHAEQRWEIEPATAFTLADLDSNEIIITVEEAIRRGRLEDPGTRDPEELLRGLGLIRDGRLLRAAAVLFGRSERLAVDYPQCLLKVARFRGTDRTEFLDNRQFHGNVFDLLRRAQRFVLESIPIAGHIEPGQIARVDEPLYPPLAVREALANGFCHREYSWGTGSVSVGIYDDRLEVTSSGSLHFGLTPEALYEPHESLPWNPLIAGVLYRCGVIEQWGRGTLRMSELTKAAGLPRPEIESIAGAVVVRFRPGRYEPPLRAGIDLTERQRAILAVLAQERAGLSRHDIAARLPQATTARQVKSELAVLKQLGLIDFSGRTNTLRWKLLS